MKKGEFSEPILHEYYNKWFFWKGASDRIQKIMNTYEKSMRIEEYQKY